MFPYGTVEVVCGRELGHVGPHEATVTPGTAPNRPLGGVLRYVWETRGDGTV